MARPQRFTGTLDNDTTLAEAFRILRSNVEVLIADLDHRSIMVTSANAGEGKTITSVNLAASIASTGRRVVLVDLDLRHPDVHTHLDVHNEIGSADVLLGRRPLSECLQYVTLAQDRDGEGRGFYVLPVGSVVDSPAELLSTARMNRLIEAIAGQADAVIIDAPPVLPIADALSIGRVAGGVVMVVEAGHTTYPQIERAIQLLTRSQARLLGVVLNKSRASIGYGYGYPAAP